MVAAVSNALGTINPIDEIAGLAHEAGGLLLVDAAQAAPHMPIDIQAIDCDFLAISGHKMLGPRGSARSGAAAPCWTPCRPS